MAIYRYIITADTGMAPAIDDALLSLATCKPQIRKSAQPGDWVVACRGSPAPPGLVAWAARIERKVGIGPYEREYRGRSDAVYRERPDGSYERLRPDYHDSPEQQRKDLSGPALIFARQASWYFGDRPQLLSDHLQHLAPRGQGHRVNGTLAPDERALIDWLLSLGPPGLRGRPPDRELCGGCAPKPARRSVC